MVRCHACRWAVSNISCPSRRYYTGLVSPLTGLKYYRACVLPCEVVTGSYWMTSLADKTIAVDSFAAPITVRPALPMMPTDRPRVESARDLSQPTSPSDSLSRRLCSPSSFLTFCVPQTALGEPAGCHDVFDSASHNCYLGEVPLLLICAGAYIISSRMDLHD